MPKLFSLNKIVMPDNTVIPRRSVFDATVEQAKQFDKLGAARPATEDEIKAAKDAAAEADGTAFFSKAALDASEATITSETVAADKPKSK